MNKSKNIRFVVITVLICAIVELCFSNFGILTMALSGCDEKTFTVSDATVSDGSGSAKVSEDKITVKGGVILFENISQEVNSLSFVLNGDEKYISVTVSYTDDNFASDVGLNRNTITVDAYAGDNTSNYVKLSPLGKTGKIRLTFNSQIECEFQSMTINAKPAFSFNVFRMLALVLVCIVVKFKFWRYIAKEKTQARCIAGAAAFMCLVMLGSAVLIAQTEEYVSLFKNYPKGNFELSEQYNQLFEAVIAGRTNIEVDFDLSKLDSLDNPYDASERGEKGIEVGNFWDRAYYDGKFYTYFGVAPVFTVYLPVFLATRKEASTVLASALLGVYAIIFISLLYNTVVRKFCKGTPLVLVLLGQLSVISAAMIFSMASETSFYYIAVLSGIGWLAAFMYFLLKAYYAEKPYKKMLYLVWTGISVVLIVASRPNLVLYAAVALIPAFYVFGNKKESIKNKLLYIISIGAPVILGAILLMVYNYVRFENPFEFGFSYQMTVCMSEVNTITLSMIPFMLYHYFIQPMTLGSDFPYVTLSSVASGHYSRYVYVGPGFGALNFPVLWGMFAAPFVKDSKRKFKNYFLFTLVVMSFVVAFVDMCKGGVHIRYTADILLPLALVGVVGLFDFLSVLKANKFKHYSLAYVAVVALMLISIGIGTALCFASENMNLYSNYPHFARILRMLVFCGC